MNDKLKQVTDASFEDDVINSPHTVLVDFWAPWCAPCKALLPILDQIADDYDGKIIVAKINIDDNEQTAQKYGIRGIPTLLLFKNGVVEATKTGSLTRAELSTFIDTNI
jgi:thioredoxin 1